MFNRFQMCFSLKEIFYHLLRQNYYINNTLYIFLNKIIVNFPEFDTVQPYLVYLFVNP